MVILISASKKKLSIGCPKFLATEAKLGSIICIYRGCEGDDDDDDDDDDASKVAPAA